ARDPMPPAPPVGLALQNVRLYASEKDRRVLNESLLEVSRVILGTPTEDNALGTVLDQMWRVVRYQAAAAVVLEGDELRVAASRGGSVDVRVPLYVANARNAVLSPVAHEGTAPAEEKRVTERRLDLSAPLLAPLVEERKTLVFQGETGPPPDSVSPFLGARSLLLIPLVSRDVIVGAVAVANLSQAVPFDPVLIEYLHDVCQPLALGLENARLFSTLTLMAATDEMTGVANRRKFMETLRVEVSRSRRTTDPLSLLLLDLDHLK